MKFKEMLHDLTVKEFLNNPSICKKELKSLNDMLIDLELCEMEEEYIKSNNALTDKKE